MSKHSKKACIGRRCVACGCCLKICPLNALSIDHGVIAVVDNNKCVGCGKCAKVCPAGVIEIKEGENS